MTVRALEAALLLVFISINDATAGTHINSCSPSNKPEQLHASFRGRIWLNELVPAWSASLSSGLTEQDSQGGCGSAGSAVTSEEGSDLEVLTRPSSSLLPLHKNSIVSSPAPPGRLVSFNTSI